MKFNPSNLTFPHLSWPVKAASSAAVLALLVGGVYAATHISQPSKNAHLASKTTVSTPAAKQASAATQSSSPTPTASPVAAHLTSTSSKTITSKVLAVAPKISIPVVPMGPASTPTPVSTGDPSVSPTPTLSPVTYDPQVESWFYSYASSALNNIYVTFEKMGTDANNNDITAIVGDCQAESEFAHDLEYNEPPVPLSGVNLNLDTSLNSLIEGSNYCVEGINNSDSNEAVNGINGMEDAILGLISIQQQMVPSN
jgi:hypothetical protein